MIQPSTIRWFLILAEEGDLKRSAKRCGVTQKAFRDQIAQLETTQGGQLCRVEGSRVDLTEAGLQLRSNLVSQSATRSSCIRIIQDPAADQTMPSWIAAAARRSCPDIRVRVMHGELKQQMDQLQSGQVDLCLIYGFPIALAENRFAYQLLHIEPVPVLLSREHPLSRASQLHWNELSAERWILPAHHRMPYIHDVFSWEVRRAGVVPARQAPTPNAPLIDIVASGAAISLAPLSFLLRCPPEIVALPLDPPLAVPFGVVFKPGRVSKRIAQLLRLFRQLTADRSSAEERAKVSAFSCSFSLSRNADANQESESPVCLDSGS